MLLYRQPPGESYVAGAARIRTGSRTTACRPGRSRTRPGTGSCDSGWRCSKASTSRINPARASPSRSRLVAVARRWSWPHPPSLHSIESAPPLRRELGYPTSRGAVRACRHLDSTLRLSAFPPFRLPPPPPPPPRPPRQPPPPPHAGRRKRPEPRDESRPLPGRDILERMTREPRLDPLERPLRAVEPGRRHEQPEPVPGPAAHEVGSADLPEEHGPQLGPYPVRGVGAETGRPRLQAHHTEDREGARGAVAARAFQLVPEPPMEALRSGAAGQRIDAGVARRPGRRLAPAILPLQQRRRGVRQLLERE